MCLPADDKLLNWLAQGVAEGRITEAQASDILKRRLRAIFGYWPDDEANNRALMGLPRLEIEKEIQNVK